MSYQVLARKWRPRAFPEMVGQEHVLRALINALDNDRLHHAFLFTGTRGVGKTTVARILAKSLNCERGVSSRPCGECSACREIDEGRFVDLIEVDAASRTRVEDTRELLENVQYAPTRGRYKVYLIDEVHMLSNHSFNALLKTLEEPPPHVKFLLATTDPQRLPITILSRCLQFNLKRLPVELIRGHLSRIMGEEGIEAELTALTEVARAADGSMRDALSLLDQAIAYGGGRLTAVEVRDMLGTIDRDRVVALLRALAAGDGTRLLAESAALAEQAPDYGGVLNELTGMLHRIALAKALPGAVDEAMDDREAVLELAGSLSPEDVQLYYQIGITGRRDLPLAPEPRAGFEMVLLRMLAFRPVEPGESAAAPVNAGGAVKATAAPEPRVAAPSTGARERSQAEPAVQRETPPSVAEPPPPRGNAAPASAAAARSAVEAVRRTLEKKSPEPRVSAPMEGAAARALADPEPHPSAEPEPAPEPEGPLEVEAQPEPPEAEPQSERELPLEQEPQPGSNVHQEPQAERAAPSESMEPLAWRALVDSLELAGMPRQLAVNCSPERVTAGQVELILDRAFGHLNNPKWHEALKEALEGRLGEKIRLSIRVAASTVATPEKLRQEELQARQQAAEQSIEEDPNVQALLKHFDGRIVPGSIRPV